MDVPKGDIEVQTLLAPLPLPFLTTTEHVFGQVTVYTMTALLSSVLEAWRSIPSVPPISEGVIVRAPPHCHYTTVTGWKVELMSLFTYMHYTTTAAQRQPLDHLKQWQKLGWNSVAILILPFQLFARWGIPVFLFFARDVVAWGLYPIVRHCIVFPYHRKRIQRWKDQNVKIVSAQKEKNTRCTFRFHLDQVEYSFADCNSFLKKDGGNIRLCIVRCEEEVPTQDSSTIVTYVWREEKWKKLCHETQFAPLKVAVGLLWLRFAVVIMALFLFSGAVVVIFLRETIHEGECARDAWEHTFGRSEWNRVIRLQCLSAGNCAQMWMGLLGGWVAWTPATCLHYLLERDFVLADYVAKPLQQDEGVKS